MPKSPIMVLTVQDNKVPPPEAILTIARKTGRSPLSVAWEILRRSMPPQRLFPAQYVGLGVWRQELSRDARSRYVSNPGSHGLNTGLIHEGAENRTPFLMDKYLAALALEAAGLRTPRIKAVYAREAGFGAHLVLRRATDLAAFLADPANLPCFCKPVGGSRAAGSVWVQSSAGDGMVILGDGRKVSAMDLAEEAAAHFPRGWLIQDFVQAHPAIARVTGPALATMRLVTIWPKGGSPRLFYGVWRLPGPGAQNDSTGAGRNGLALIDAETGVVSRVYWGDYLDGSPVEVSPAAADGAPIMGFQVPEFQRLADLVCKAHQMFPGHGILGWDATVTSEGPLVTEVNTSPFHTMLQRVTGGPFRTPEHEAIFADAAAGLAERVGPGRKRWWQKWR